MTFEALALHGSGDIVDERQRRRLDGYNNLRLALYGMLARARRLIASSATTVSPTVFCPFWFQPRRARASSYSIGLQCNNVDRLLAGAPEQRHVHVSSDSLEPLRLHAPVESVPLDHEW